MRERVFNLRFVIASTLVLLPILSGCGPVDSPVDPTPGNDLLAPPPAGQGFQFQMKATIESGTEGEWCQFVKGPPEAFFVNRDEVRYSAGSHHFLLYETSYTEIPTQNENGMAVDTSDVFNCSDGATNGWKVTKLVGGSQNSDGTSMLSFPPDVGMSVHANAVLLMNAHYINASAGTLEPEVRINLHTIPEAQVKQEGDILFLYNPFIHVPKLGTSRARMRCQVHKDITVQNVQSHMHARGNGYEALQVGGETFYTNTVWENVPVKDFGQGLAFKAGSWIDYACDYQNTGMQDVYQGPRSTDEMCMLIGSYYPADPATAQCALDVNNPDQTANLGAEWVGNGSASCATTLGCIQQNFGPNFNMEGLTQCVVGSEPAVSREMSDVLHCIFTAANPLMDCKTQIDTCVAK